MPPLASPPDDTSDNRDTRVPEPGDRVFWAGDAHHPRREGEVSGVYADRRGDHEELVCDISWDPPPATASRP